MCDSFRKGCASLLLTSMRLRMHIVITWGATPTHLKPMKTKASSFLLLPALVGILGFGVIEFNKRVESAKAKRFAERCITVHSDNTIKGTTTAAKALRPSGS